jgi:phage-related protein
MPILVWGSVAEKPVIWLGTARDDLRGFPADARQVAGFQLWRVQRGLEPNDWKPMPAVGLGVREVRVHTGLEHRVVYLAKFDEAVYVLHAFQKRSQQTRKRDLELARQRLRALLKRRRQGGR